MTYRIAILLTMLVGAASAADISSPYAPNFWSIPRWLPNGVSAEDTPGSDAAMMVTVTTNVIVTPWVLARGSKTRWNNGDECYHGALPQWAGDKWSDASDILDFDSTPYKQEDWPGCTIDTYGWEQSGFQQDEQATSLAYFVNSEVYRDGTYVEGDYCTAVFTRTISNVVTAVTNVIPKRLTEAVQSSSVHTLDGWAEREFFTGVPSCDTNRYDLLSTPLNTFGTNRVVASRRVSGKTNLWAVADEILYEAYIGWHSHLDPDRRIPETITTNCYTNTVYRERLSTNGWWTTVAVTNVTTNTVVTSYTNGPYAYPYTAYSYFTSTAFDDIYGPQIPDDIDWNEDGLYSLSNRLALLGGLKYHPVWKGGGSGWDFGTFPEYLLFNRTKDLSYYYHCRLYDIPEFAPSHPFDFPGLCRTNDYPYCFVDEITNRTTRLELVTEGAVNQTMTMLDRTIVHETPDGRTGEKTRYEFNREYIAPTKTFDELGLTFDPQSSCWVADEDIYLEFSEATNYLETTVSPWGGTTGNDSLEIEVSGNSAYSAPHEFWDAGRYTLLTAEDLIRDLTAQHTVGETGTVYSVYVRDCIMMGDEVQCWMSSNIPGYGWWDTYAPSHATDTWFRVSVQVGNAYSVAETRCPDYTALRVLPHAQAWGYGSHERVGSCTDICTASILREDGLDDGGYVVDDPEHYNYDICFHCHVINRTQSDDMQRLHEYEWNAHRSKASSLINERHPNALDNPLALLYFDKGSTGLDSYHVKRGHYNVYPYGSAEPIELLYDPHRGWYKASDREGPLSVYFEVAFDTEMDSPSITENPGVKIYCRQHITNVVDWNWNSIRKQTDE